VHHGGKDSRARWKASWAHGEFSRSSRDDRRIKSHRGQTFAKSQVAVFNRSTESKRHTVRPFSVFISSRDLPGYRTILAHSRWLHGRCLCGEMKIMPACIRNCKTAERVIGIMCAWIINRIEGFAGWVINRKMYFCIFRRFSLLFRDWNIHRDSDIYSVERKGYSRIFF